MEFKIGNVVLTVKDIIFTVIILSLLVLALVANYKMFKKIKNTFIKILFIIEFLIRIVVTYYIFYYFILILALNSSLKEKILAGVLFVMALFVPVIPGVILFLLP
ncbi:hypothetical protein [Fusobacterium russii]|uniref:hypothetical protein n=1 Tax=Fusobacterium russii TaxID=854 RepID=UPI0003A8A55A|nr:hypothetical protein [Fusobacterium russii]